MFKKFAVFFLITAVLFAFTSCGKKAQSNQQANNTSNQKETVQEQNTPTDTQASETTPPITVTQGEQTKKVKLPDGFPTDFFPIMENASGSCFEINGAYMLIITTPSTTDEIVDFYTKAFSKYGDKFIVSGDKREIKVEGDGKSADILIDNLVEGKTLRITVKK